MNLLSKLSNTGLLMTFSAALALLLAVSACNRETSFPEPKLEPGSLSSHGSNTLILDNEITGRLTRKNSGNTYMVTVVEEGLYQFEMRSDKLDAYLELDGEGVNFSNDDNDGDLDAKLIAHLQPGAYRLHASDATNGTAGVYTIKFSRRSLPDDISLQNDGILNPDSTITGLYIGQPRKYTLSIPRRVFSIIEMKSEDIDSLIEISGSGVEASDDDSGDNLDAGIFHVLEPGRYTISVSAIDEQGAGLYTLRTRLLDIASSNAQPTVEPGTAIGRNIAAGQTDTIDLQIKQAGKYIIDMVSADFDAFLEIRGQGIDESNDDGYKSTSHARLSLALSPGKYQLRAKSFGSDEKGGYVLLVSNSDQPSLLD